MDLESLRTGPLQDVRDPAPEVSATTVFRGKVWDIRSETVRFAGGEITREFMAHTGAVAVLARDDDDRVLLINQYRQPIGARDWELPAGLLDQPGEEPLVSPFSSPGGSNEVIHIFEARGLSATESAHERTDEESEIVVRWAPLDEVVAAVLDGRLRNGPLMIAALAAHARRA